MCTSDRHHHGLERSCDCISTSDQQNNLLGSMSALLVQWQVPCAPLSLDICALLCCRTVIFSILQMDRLMFEHMNMLQASHMFDWGKIGGPGWCDTTVVFLKHCTKVLFHEEQYIWTQDVTNVTQITWRLTLWLLTPWCQGYPGLVSPEHWQDWSISLRWRHMCIQCSSVTELWRVLKRENHWRVQYLCPDSRFRCKGVLLCFAHNMILPWCDLSWVSAQTCPMVSTSAWPIYRTIARYNHPASYKPTMQLSDLTHDLPPIYPGKPFLLPSISTCKYITDKTH